MTQPNPSRVLVLSTDDSDKWRKALQTQLQSLARQTPILIWDDKMTAPGKETRAELERQVHEADVAVLLVSPEFLKSDPIQNHHIPQLLERHERGELEVFPIIVSPCGWEDETWLSAREIRPSGGKPLASHSTKKANELLLAVAREIKKMAVEQRERRETKVERETMREQLSQYAATLAAFKANMAHFEASGKRDQAEVSLNVDRLDVEVFLCGDGERAQYVLETRVELKNNGTQTACIPAVYVFARALIDRDSLVAGAAHFYKNDIQALPKCGPLSEPRNIARIENSIVQVAPGEVEHYVRWDAFSSDFVENYPVIVVDVEVFGAPHELLGFGTVPNPFKGRLRAAWLDLMNGKERTDNRRHEKIIFARAQRDYPENEVEMGDRVILDPNLETPDFEATRTFREVLKGMFQWSRQSALRRSHLRGIKAAHARH